MTRTSVFFTSAVPWTDGMKSNIRKLSHAMARMDVPTAMTYDDALKVQGVVIGRTIQQLN